MKELSLERVTGLVSVVTANHDYGRYLVEGLESLRLQTYSQLEVVIVDDYSRDDSASLVRDWLAARRPDFPVFFHELPRNCGYAWAMNVGISLANGEFIAFQDADDLSHPERLARQVAWFGSNADGGLVGTNYTAFDDGRFDQQRRAFWLKYGDDIPAHYKANAHCVSTGTAMVRGSVIDRLGPFNRRYPGAEDYELVARIVGAGYLVDNLHEVLYHNRCHPGKRSHLYYGKAEKS